MSELPIVITSTAANVGDSIVERCIQSVRFQRYSNWRHVYVLADARPGDLRLHDCNPCPDDSRIELCAPAVHMAPTLANLWPIWQSLPDHTIIAWLDGDDTLLLPHALATVAAAHAAGAVMTYGQFVWGDGSLGFAAPVGPDPRNEPWHATHLKTFRAGLVKRLAESDLRMPCGEWSFLNDQPVMLPLLELAGPRARFIETPIYRYSVQNLQHEMTRHAEGHFPREHAEVARVRALARYPGLSDAEIDLICQDPDATAESVAVVSPEALRSTPSV